MANDEKDTKGVGESQTRRGEEMAGKEAGRQDAGFQGPTKRPVGTSTARDSTGVGAQDPIDEESPNLQTGG
ncbi:MAG: hypothetical protein ACR2OO_17845 [Thermomicrobiales bacterium]